MNFGLVPFVAFCLLLVVVRDRPSLRRPALGGLLLALGILAVTQFEWRTNLARFGGLTPMQEAVVNRSRGRTAGDLLGVAAAMDWSKVVRRLWLRDSFFAGGWSFLGTDVRLVKLYYFAGLAGLAGWGWRVVARGRRESAVFESCGAGRLPGPVRGLHRRAGVPHGPIEAGLGLATTTPWYACPALPWFLMLVAGGGLAWPIGRFRAAVPVLLDGGLPGRRIVRRLGPDGPDLFGRRLRPRGAPSPGPLAAPRVRDGDPPGRLDRLVGHARRRGGRPLRRRRTCPGACRCSPSRPAPTGPARRTAPAHPADVPGSPR